jgi:hypothetical protein
MLVIRGKARDARSFKLRTKCKLSGKVVIVWTKDKSVDGGNTTGEPGFSCLINNCVVDVLKQDVV